MFVKEISGWKCIYDREFTKSEMQLVSKGRNKGYDAGNDRIFTNLTEKQLNIELVKIMSSPGNKLRENQ